MSATRRIRFSVLQRQHGRRKKKLVSVWLSQAEVEQFYRVGMAADGSWLGWTQDGRHGAIHRKLRDDGLVLMHNGGFRCYFARLTETGHLLHTSITKAAEIEAKRKLVAVPAALATARKAEASP